MNSEWQRYDSQREEYIQKLLNKIKDLEEKNVRLNNDIGVTMAEMVRDVEIDRQPLDPQTHREYNPKGGFDEPDSAIENV